MRRLAAGERATVPVRLGIHLIAARYGQTPESVRAWRVDDYIDALAMYAATGDGARRRE